MRQYLPPQNSADGVYAISQNVEDLFSPNYEHINKEIWMDLDSQNWIEMGSKQGYMADGRLCTSNPCLFWEVPAYGNYALATDYIGPATPLAGQYSFEIAYGANGTWDCWLNVGGIDQYYRGISRYSTFRYSYYMQAGIETGDSENTLGNVTQTVFDSVQFRNTNARWGAWPSQVSADNQNMPTWPYVSTWIDPALNGGDAQIIIKHT